MLELTDIVQDFATAIKLVDTEHPQAKSSRSGRIYQPGIGPFAEDTAVDMIVAKLRKLNTARYDRCSCRSLYPDSKQRCDLLLGESPEWALEIKMARFLGDNGKPDETAVKDILSPFECDRSAVVDCGKLAQLRTRLGTLFDELRRGIL